MLAELTELGFNPSSLEILGLSLGGQTMSFIGKHFYKMTGRKIGKLTGLDPSGPCFRHLGPDQRLDSSDADFVVILNTNIDGYGMAAPAGHVTFYINGGELQAADLLLLPCDSLCSHVRVFTLWWAAIEYNNDQFIGIKCESVQQARLHACYDRVPVETNVVGLNTNRSNEGIFYLATDYNWPYFLGKKGLKREHEFWLNRLASWNSEDSVTL